MSTSAWCGPKLECFFISMLCGHRCRWTSCLDWLMHVTSAWWLVLKLICLLTWSYCILMKYFKPCLYENAWSMLLIWNHASCLLLHEKGDSFFLHGVPLWLIITCKHVAIFELLCYSNDAEWWFLPCCLNMEMHECMNMLVEYMNAHCFGNAIPILNLACYWIFLAWCLFYLI